MNFIHNLKPVYTNSRSTLYKAQWNNNTVAVKYVPRRMCIMENVLTEVTVLQKLQGLKHVVRYIDVIENEKDIYIIMEWINGMNLKEYILQKEIALTEDSVREIVYPLMEILRVCCDMNLIYGDVKPENIMLEPSGQVKLIDFGCTRAIGSVYDTYLGTPLYFSPEMFYQVCLPQYDVWGLGLILYYLASTKHPFVSVTPYDMMHLKSMIMETPLMFEDDVWKNWSAEGKDLIMRMLEKDPLKRLTIHGVSQHVWFKNVIIMDDV